MEKDIKMTNYNHLSKDQRDIIQYMIDQKYSFTQIGKAIHKDRTTISKELKRNRYIKSYTISDVFDSKAINKSVLECSKLAKPPYVCNTCKSKGGCRKNKLYYHSNTAHNHYKANLILSRQGVDIKLEVIDEIEHCIVPLIKDKKQSIN